MRKESMSTSTGSEAKVHSADSSETFLFVTSGRHQGACVPLARDSLLVLGGDSASDVWLSDPGLASRHVAFAVHDDHITLRQLDGEVLLDGKCIDAVATLDVARQESITLQPGDIHLIFTTDADYCATDVVDSEMESLQPYLQQKHRQSTRSTRAAATALACVILIAVAFFANQYNVQAKIEPVPPQTAIQLMIDELDLTDEIVVDESFGQLIIRGTLTSEELSRLKFEILRSSHTVIFRITTAEQLLEQVGGVFRTNGYTAKLSYSGNATVVVENLDGESLEIQKIAAFVRADVANLKELVFTPSESPESDGTNTAVYLATAGKRLTTIVEGDIAYITTEDGARYFVGSTLPGGHYVRQITEQGVQVDSGDTISWLQF